jgi:AGZA family xanthine/uracil permease-like MFS transporter
MSAWLERWFGLKQQQSSPRTEVLAGVTTFMTMAYIIFVQPAVLSQAGMDFNSVMMATCLSAAAASMFMGVLANYPIALAPGMGENFFFTFTVIIAAGVPWQTALGIVLLSGLLFMLLNLFRIRQALIDAIPESLKHAIAGGIGLFIAFIGLSEAGIITRNNGPLAGAVFSGELTIPALLDRLGLYEVASGAVKLGDLSNPGTLLAIFGIVATFFFLVRRIKGAIFWGILLTLIVGLISGLVQWQGLASAPPSMAPTFLKADLLDALQMKYLPIILVFLFMAVFDTIGTMIGVCDRAGFIKEGKLPKASRILWVDATGTMLGALFGTSTVTAYIESAAGVEEGGRTGLTAIVTGLFFLAAIFFSPLIRMVGGGVPAAPGSSLLLYPITAPALIVVGCLMIQSAAKIKWDDLTEAIPAFLLMIGMPLTYSIADGLAFGFITYPLLKIFSGRVKETSWLVYLLGVIFVARYIFLR